jgi:hypothetical protein
MNIDNLSTKDYCSLINQINFYYKYKLPKDVLVALFFSIEHDQDRIFYKLEKQISMGKLKLDKLLLRMNPELHQKLFHE